MHRPDMINMIKLFAMRIVFMGTPDFAKNILAGLVDAGCDVVAVYTRADAVRGRGKNLVPSPVKEYATSQGIAVETPENFNSEDTIATLKQYKPDFIVVAAYGLILPKDVLDIPTYECLNVHGSLLPKWRGAAPVQRAILAGDKKSGFTIMNMDEGMDTGGIHVTEEFSIEGKTTNEVFDQIARLAPDALINTMRLIVAESMLIEDAPQDDSKATIAEKLGKRELWFAKNDSDEIAYRKYLASTSESPAKCSVAGKVVTVLDAKLENGKLQILKLKPDGKNEMD